jgi:hypothetical protein
MSVIDDAVSVGGVQQFSVTEQPLNIFWFNEDQLTALKQLWQEADRLDAERLDYMLAEYGMDLVDKLGIAYFDLSDRDAQLKKAIDAAMAQEKE